MTYQWDDPLFLNDQLSEEERMIRDSTRQFAEEKLFPTVREAFHNETFDREADEPTGALDTQTSQEIMNLLLNLNQQEQRTILIITHDHAVSLQCQQINTIRDGRIS